MDRKQLLVQSAHEFFGNRVGAVLQMVQQDRQALRGWEEPTTCARWCSAAPSSKAPAPRQAPGRRRSPNTNATAAPANLQAGQQRG